ncbi:hypothetical protein ACQPUY_15560 [Clostridium nigeriense]|uniref:hypothetical protein n=1 Tax=Clostridium nigeriense TaxID=1805470 RepID=UPI003D3314F3
MGATNFVEEVTTTGTVRNAFDSLISEYEREYGQRRYNGTISTCSLGSCKLSFDKYSEGNYKKAQKYIIDNHHGSKWIADYIDLGVVGYKVITVKKEFLKNKPDYKLRFVVSKYTYFEKIKTNFNYLTKKEADEKALSLTLDSGVEHIVSKEYVLVNNSKSDCSRFYVDNKIYKNKPNLKPMKNRKILPIKKYLFFGWASC